MAEKAKVPTADRQWSSLDIFLFSNGQDSNPPRKFHLTSNELEWWDKTLSHLASTQDEAKMHPSVDLYTLNGKKVLTPLELRHGMAYVAVSPNEKFIPAGYEHYLTKASKSREKREKRKDADAEDEDVAAPDILQTNPILDNEKTSFPLEQTPDQKTNKSEQPNALDNISNGQRDSILSKKPEKRRNSPASFRSSGQEHRRLSSVTSSPTPFRKTSPSTSRKESSSTPGNLKLAKPDSEKRPSLNNSNTKYPSPPHNVPVLTPTPTPGNKEDLMEKVNYVNAIPNHKSQLTENSVLREKDDAATASNIYRNTESEITSISIDSACNLPSYESSEQGQEKTSSIKTTKQKSTDVSVIQSINEEGSSFIGIYVTKDGAKNNDNSAEQVTWASLIKNNNTHNRIGSKDNSVCSYENQNPNQIINGNPEIPLFMEEENKGSFNRKDPLLKISSNQITRNVTKLSHHEFPETLKQTSIESISAKRIINHEKVVEDEKPTPKDERISNVKRYSNESNISVQKNLRKLSETTRQSLPVISENDKSILDVLLKNSKQDNIPVMPPGVKKISHLSVPVLDNKVSTKGHSEQVFENIHPVPVTAAKDETVQRSPKRKSDNSTYLRKNSGQATKNAPLEIPEIKKQKKLSDGSPQEITTRVPSKQSQWKNVKPKIDDKGLSIQNVTTNAHQNSNLTVSANKQNSKILTKGKPSPTPSRTVKPLPTVNINQMFKENDSVLKNTSQDNGTTIINSKTPTDPAYPALKPGKTKSLKPLPKVNRLMPTMKSGQALSGHAQQAYPTNTKDETLVVKSNRTLKSPKDQQLGNSSSKSKAELKSTPNDQTLSNPNNMEVEKVEFKSKVDMLVLSDKDNVKGLQQDGATATEQFVTVLRNAEIVNLQLNLEVRNNDGKMVAKISSQKSSSVTDIRKGNADEVRGQSKSMDSLEAPPHICCQRGPRSHVHQCACCDHFTHEDTSNVKLLGRADNKTYYILVPVAASANRCCINQKTVCEGTEQLLNGTVEGCCNCRDDDFNENANKTEKEVEHCNTSVTEINVVTSVKETSTTPVASQDNAQNCFMESSRTSVLPQMVLTKTVSITSVGKVEIVQTDDVLRYSNATSMSSVTKAPNEDKSIQTDSCNLIMEVHRHEDGRYTFHLPPLEALKLRGY